MEPAARSQPGSDREGERGPGRLARAGAAAIAASVGAIALAADAGAGRAFFEAATRAPGGDKTMHVVLIGALSFAVGRAFPGPLLRLGQVRIPAESLALAALATLEEASQLVLANRTADPLDLACNYLGVFVFGALARASRPGAAVPAPAPVARPGAAQNTQ